MKRQNRGSADRGKNLLYFFFNLWFTKFKDRFINQNGFGSFLRDVDAFAISF